MLRSLIVCGLVVSSIGTGTLRAADPWEMRHNLTATDFEKASKDLADKSYRPVQLSAAVVGKDKEVRFLAVWEKHPDAPAWVAHHELTAKQYAKIAADLKDLGFRAVDLCGYEVGGEVRFAAIWEKEPKDAPAREAHHALTSDDYRKLDAALSGKGYHPLRLGGYAVGKEARYATIWEKAPKDAPAWHTRRDMTSAQYQEEFNAQVDKGYRLVHVAGYTIDGEERFAGVWQKAATKTEWQARHAMDATLFETTAAQMKEQLLRPLRVNSHAVNGQLCYAGVWVKE